MNLFLRPAIVLFVVLSVITGLLYPAAITGIAQSLMPRQANGSLLVKGGKPIGSSLMGQEFSDPKYFWGRLSATSPVPYTSFNADKSQGSAGSNLSPTNPDLVKNVQARIDALRAADELAGYKRSEGMPVPVDLVTSSASGLDPAITPAAAAYQTGRVAKARGIDEAAVRAIVVKFTEQRQLGVLGEPGVNVLQLNLALDAEFPPKQTAR